MELLIEGHAKEISGMKNSENNAPNIDKEKL